MKNITRRDFLNGTLLGLSTYLMSPMAFVQCEETQIAKHYYPPLWNGMRGSNDRAFQVAQQLARSHRKVWGQVSATLDRGVTDF